MEEKKYLKWYNKVGYGSGDIAGNVVYAFLSSFVMIFLTDTIGLNPGIIGTLMAVSKLFDGVTDIFFGSLIDKTHTRMGKARPWMFGGYFGCAATLVMIFAVPTSLGVTAQYAWFFIAYTLLNAVFYTANNIAYSALTALITKNSQERVQMGSIRFMFAFGTSLLIQIITIDAVEALGGGAAGWRTIAIIYAVIGLVVNTLSCFSVHELPEDVLDETSSQAEEKKVEKYTLKDAFRLLTANKYYLMIVGIYILTQIFTAMINMGTYFTKYALGNAHYFKFFSTAVNIPQIIGLVFTPILITKTGSMFKINRAGYGLAIFGRAMVIIAGYLHSLPMMLIFTAVAALGMSPLQGDLNALIAECSEYTFLTKKKRVDGTMFSCTSLGVKIGGGLGTALAGWLLAAGDYTKNAVAQPSSAIHMLNFIYLWLPLILNIIILVILLRLNVEDANRKLRETGDRH
ncbi:MAG: glycoside-pentoside-hexuronide (GPH):cation symporter [Lachnospiraceae bacterium]|nr:glycoside-pentoside-hexuronide (GPH):cation symporter [Lachnospiraceae bacterium]